MTEPAARAADGSAGDRKVWLEAQKEAFQAAMNGAPLGTSLGIIVDAVVREAGDGRRCAFYIANADGKTLRHVVGMPDEAQATEGLAIAADMLEDRWQPWTRLAREYGYRDCWSMPVETTSGRRVGWFAFYFAEPHAPEPRDHELAATLTPTAAIIISRHQENEERARAEAALREREADLARVQRIGGIGGLDIDIAGGLRSMRSPEYRRLHGLPDELGEESHADWLARVHPDDRGQAERALFAALDSDASTYASEYRIVRPSDGAVRWIDARADIERDADGKATRLIGAHVDITEQKRASEALRASEERLRGAVEVGRLGLWDWNFSTGDIHWSDEHFRMEGYAVGEVSPSYQAWAARIHPDDREATEAALREAMESRGEYIREFRVVHPDGSTHWLYGRGRFFYGPSGEPTRMVGAMVDITERREWEERQQILVGELQHRVRNMLAVVRSVFSRTAETAADMEELELHFKGRLDALARTQMIVTSSAEGRVDLEDLIRDELLSVGASDGPDIAIGGPDVMLTPTAAESLGLAIHELTTNAVKYGALKIAGAKLSVTWAINLSERQNARLDLTWNERGVPTVPVTPSRAGFGRELIEEALPYRLGAETRLEFRGGGIRCSISLPLHGNGSDGLGGVQVSEET